MGLLTSDKPAAAAGRRRATGLPADVLYVSIVAAIDGARFAVVAANEEQCIAQVASYVAEQAPRQLWPRSAQRVQQLLAAGNDAGAVAEYFRRSGERWDREWLVTRPLRADSSAATWSGAVPLPGLARLGGDTCRPQSGRDAAAGGRDVGARDGATRAGQRVPAAECALHDQRLQLHLDVPGPAAADGYRPNYVLGRLSVRVDGRGAGLSRQATACWDSETWA
jgi:hypothetical protein